MQEIQLKSIVRDCSNKVFPSHPSLEPVHIDTHIFLSEKINQYKAIDWGEKYI